MLLGAPSVAISRGHVSFGGFVRVALDPTLIVLCLLLSSTLAGSGFGGPELVLAVIVVSLTFPSEVSLHKLRQNLLGTIFVNWLLLVALLCFFGYATKFLWEFDQRMLLIWIGITPFVLYGAHRAIPYLVPQLLAIDGYRGAVVIAANEVGLRLAANLVDHPALGFRFMGFFDDGQFKEAVTLPGPVLGTVDTAAEYVKANRVEAVFIALPMAAQPRLLKLLDEIKDTT